MEPNKERTLAVNILKEMIFSFDGREECTVTIKGDKDVEFKVSPAMDAEALLFFTVLTIFWKKDS